jgi:cobalt-zinc-cadmium efflux system membrane fusion protein
MGHASFTEEDIKMTKMKTMKSRRTIKTMMLFALFILAACQAKVQDNPAAESASLPADQLVFTDDQIELAGIVSGKLEQKTLSDELDCNGSIEVPPQSMVSVSLPMEAYARKVNYINGSAVKKGDILAVMEHPDILSLQREYLVTGNNLGMLKEDLDRQEVLARENASSGKKLTAARTEYKNELVHYRALGEQLSLIGIDPGGLDAQNMSPRLNIRSPIDGFIRDSHVTTGELLKAGQPIMVLEDISHLHLHLVVYEKDITKVKPGQQVVFSTGASDREYRGTVHTVSKSIDEETRSADVHVHVDNPDAQLLSGMYVKAKILINRRTMPALPEGGIVNDGGRSYLFLRDGNTFTRMPVETGIREQGYVEVKSPGLEDKEIVRAGAYYLNAGLKKEE